MSVVRKNEFFAGALSVLGASALLGLWGCSDSSVAGNSAETGSPELAGVLYLDGGKPAAMARVQCVPSHFDVLNDTLPGNYQSETNDSGAYVLDGLTAGKYSLEAFDPKSGKMLLVQNIEVSDSGRVAVSDTLQSSGYVLLDLDDESLDGSVGSALVAGTTIMRPIKVEGNIIVVDSLPADTLDLTLFLNDGKNVIDFDNVDVPAADTVKVRLTQDSLGAPIDTIVRRYVAPLTWPADADTSFGTYSSDIPIALRLDSSNCDFNDFKGLDGRWEVFRLSSDGSRSKALPISQSYFDVVSEKALFWVRVDSLNVEDSLELVFNTSLSAGYASDVFPTSRAYAAVYHFDDGVEVVSDAAEKQNYVGTGKGVQEVSGVLGSAARLDGKSYIAVVGSAESDSSRKTDLNFAYSHNINVSLWVKLDDVKSYQTILAKGESQYDLRFSPDSGFVAELFHEAEDYRDSTSDTASYKMVMVSGMDVVKAGEWTFVSFNGMGAFTMFVNGQKLAVNYAKVPWFGSRSESKDLEIGRTDGFEGPVGYLNGALDELVISGSLRPDAWTMATYLNQRPDDVWPKVVAR